MNLVMIRLSWRRGVWVTEGDVAFVPMVGFDDCTAAEDLDPAFTIEATFDDFTAPAVVGLDPVTTFETGGPGN